MSHWTRKLARAGAGLAVVAAMLAPAGGASAAVRTDGPWYLVNRANGRCLDVPAQSGGVNGSRMQLWDCYPPSQTNQMWWRRWRSSNTFELISVASRRCLDAPAQSGGADGTPMQLWDCYPPNQTNQMWRMLSTPTGWHLQNVKFAKVLDAEAGGLNRNGTKIQLWYLRTANTNQGWELRAPNAFR